MGATWSTSTRTTSRKTNTGQAILVIDSKAFGDPAPFKAAVDALVRDLRSERAPGGRRAHLAAGRTEPPEA